MSALYFRNVDLLQGGSQELRSFHAALFTPLLMRELSVSSRKSYPSG